jgi:pSer/pThr/pTyr-binding forkhead associated (FHA) protein
MPSKRLILGTHDTAGIRLNDEFVSRHHLSVRVSSHGGIHVADLDSTNGTFVNGEKAQRAEVRPGDEICIGKTKIHFIEADGRQGDNNIAVAC